MKRMLVSLVAGATLTSLCMLGTPVSVSADPGGRPDRYQLTGDPGGSKFEGIGADQRRGRFYVSEVTGGEIHRGTARSAHTEEWLGGDGTDGRFTARGVTTDRAGNIYVAGGPNGIDNDRPDLWVYSRSGVLLAALRAPAEDVFLNDGRVPQRRLGRSRRRGVLHQLQRPPDLPCRCHRSRRRRLRH